MQHFPSEYLCLDFFCVYFGKECNFSLGGAPLNDRWLPNVSSEAINMSPSRPPHTQPVPPMCTAKINRLNFYSASNPIRDTLKSSSVIARR